MRDQVGCRRQQDEGFPTFDVSDEALEALAGMKAQAAITLPASPTVSILVACCGNNYSGGDGQ
jgi:hypothetical protein